MRRCDPSPEIAEAGSRWLTSWRFRHSRRRVNPGRCSKVDPSTGVFLGCWGTARALVFRAMDASLEHSSAARRFLRGTEQVEDLRDREPRAAFQRLLRPAAC